MAIQSARNVTLRNMTIYKGTSFDETFFWVENEVPVDMTLWQAKATIKSGSRSYTASTADGTLLLGSAGEVAFNLDPVFTSGMASGTYVMDLLLIDSDGKKLQPLIISVVTVIQGPTEW